MASMISPATCSRGRPRDLSRFDTPPHGIEADACNFPLEFDTPPGVATDPPQEPGAVAMARLRSKSLQLVEPGSQSKAATHEPLGHPVAQRGSGRMPRATDEGKSARRHSPPHTLRLPIGGVLVV